jgi:hypothetical protein
MLDTPRARPDARARRNVPATDCRRPLDRALRLGSCFTSVHGLDGTSIYMYRVLPYLFFVIVCNGVRANLSQLVIVIVSCKRTVATIGDRRPDIMVNAHHITYDISYTPPYGIIWIASQICPSCEYTESRHDFHASVESHERDYITDTWRKRVTRASHLLFIHLARVS